MKYIGFSSTDLLLKIFPISLDLCLRNGNANVTV